jgi:hypothetical protein
MKASANSIGGKLFTPMTMWQVIKDEPAACRDIPFFHYVSIIALTHACSSNCGPIHA